MNITYFLILIMFGFVLQIPCFLSLIVTYPLSRLTRNRKWLKISHLLQRRIFDWIDSLWFQTTYFVSPNIQKNTRYIFLPNHQAFMDPVIARIATTGPEQFLVTVAIGYVKYIPLIGLNLVMLGIPFIGDKTNKTTGRSMNKGLVQMYTEYLQQYQNAVLVLFPEGQRNFIDQFKLEDLRSGGFVIAKNLNQQIVPVFHNIKDRFDDVKQEYNDKLAVYCVYGDPIDVQGKELDDIKLEYHQEMLKLKARVDNLRCGSLPNN